MQMLTFIGVLAFIFYSDKQIRQMK